MDELAHTVPPLDVLESEIALLLNWQAYSHLKQYLHSLHTLLSPETQSSSHRLVRSAIHLVNLQTLCFDIFYRPTDVDEDDDVPSAPLPTADGNSFFDKTLLIG
jgi:hypothetical protein